MAIDFKRLTRSLPEKTDDSVGVAFVSILFGVVVGLIVKELAEETRFLFSGNGEFADVRVGHLGVGAVLTILSYIGYYSSTHSSAHRMKFVNWPLAKFALDVLMVFLYYLTFVYAEPRDRMADSETPILNDARPEALIVATCFLLYILWDFASWRIRGDAEYQKALGENVDSDYGSRRKTTLVFCGLSFFVWLVVALVEPTGAGEVVLVDVILIVLLVTYRIMKVVVDPGVEIRH